VGVALRTESDTQDLKLTKKLVKWSLRHAAPVDPLQLFRDVPFASECAGESRRVDLRWSGGMSPSINVIPTEASLAAGLEVQVEKATSPRD